MYETSDRVSRASCIISSGAEHMNVWLRELLCDPERNYPDSLWLGSFRLSASLCVRCGDRAGWGGLWLSPVLSSEPVASHLLAQCGFRTSSTLYTSSSTVWDNSSVMAMSTVKDFTHEMLTGPYYPLIDWPSFTARRGLLIGLQLPADTVTLMEENYCCLVMH